MKCSRLIPAILSITLSATLLLSGAMAASTDLNYPHKLGKRVSFLGDFSASPTAKNDLHKADVGQWEYVTVTHDKKIVENGAIQSFDLKEIEDSGENFQGRTGYTMVYLPDDQAQRIAKMKAYASAYNGSPSFVSSQVEKLYSQITQTYLPKELYQSTDDEKKTYTWISAGHLAYLSGATDSAQWWNQCTSYIGKACGSASEIAKVNGAAPASPSTGRAMRIITPFPQITDAHIQQNNVKKRNV